MATWTDHVARWRNCQLCPLADQRSNIVLARGSVPCDVLFIGEAPGTSEDALGLPFVGPAGQLLDQIVERAIGEHSRDKLCRALGVLPTIPLYALRDLASDNNMPAPVTWAFTNLVACFPAEAKARGDNEPEVAEIKACRPRLEEFVKIAEPRLVVRVGQLAQTWVQHDAWGRVYGADTEEIDHPAFILRMPLVQRGMATQRAVVRIRTAVLKMLESSYGG